MTNDQRAYRAEVLEGERVSFASGYYGPPEPCAWIRGVNGTGVGFDDAVLGRHVLFIGGIGTGKTVGMSALVASMRERANADDVFVFFDTKGDYLDRFYRPGDASISVLGSGATPGGETWNLFSELSGVGAADLVDEVSEIAAGLVDDLGGDKNQIWSSMARDLLGSLLVAYVRSGKSYSNADIRAIADTLSVGQMRTILEAHVDLRGSAQYIAKDDSTTTISVLIFLQQAIRRVFSGAFKRRGDFSIRRFLQDKGGRALFLEYDVARGTALSQVYRTLLDICLKQALSRDRAGGRVFVILDEFSLLPQLTHLDAGLNFGRSLGLRFVVGTQNTGQIHQAYGPGLADSVLSAFGTVFAFRLFDAGSRDYVRSRFGSNRKLVRFDQVVKTRGISEVLTDGSVVEDWDLSGLRVGQTLVGLPLGPPIVFTIEYGG